jgi:hypothetical protein
LAYPVLVQFRAVDYRIQASKETGTGDVTFERQNGMLKALFANINFRNLDALL